MKGLEVMGGVGKGEGGGWWVEGGMRGEVGVVERGFGIGGWGVREGMGMVKEDLGGGG